MSEEYTEDTSYKDGKGSKMYKEWLRSLGVLSAEELREGLMGSTELCSL